MASLCFAVFAVLFTACAAQSGSILPVNISEAVVRGQTPGVCPSDQMLDSQYTATLGEIDRALADTVAPIINCPCGGAGQWTRLAGLDFSDASVPCPTGLTVVTATSSVLGPIRGCGRGTNVGTQCNSMSFPSNGVSYSRVCGRVNAFQHASVDAFGASLGTATLEQAYIDGVSLTYGPAGSRQHIWSFIGALYETAGNYNPRPNCPCTNTNVNWPFTVPAYIGNNYFCDSGNAGPGWQRQLYPDDPLWDGQGCGPTSSCCEFNNPPWFCTALPNPTTSAIELRVCHDQAQGDEDTVLSLVDIFVM